MPHRVGQEAPRGSAGSASHVSDSHIYYGSFLANDHKDLEEGLPFSIRTGMPSGLAATCGQPGAPATMVEYGECYGGCTGFLP